MRRRRLLVLGAVAVVAVVGVVLALVSDGDDGARRGRPSELLDEPVRLQPERDEAVALIRRGSRATYHARYETTGDPAGSMPRAVEIWRREGSSRTDMEYVVDGRVERSTSIRRPSGAGGSVACRRTGDEPWSCERVDEPASDLFEEASADLASAGIVARDDEVRGRSARCFAIDAEEQAELCFDENGVLLRLAVGEAALELVDLDRGVDPGVLAPPVPPAPPLPPATRD